MEEIGISELTGKEIEELCSIAEKAAREYVLSRVPPKRVDVLNVSVEAQGAKPVTLTIEVDVAFSPLIKNLDAQKLANEAIKEAYASAEEYMRELKRRSQR